MTRHRSALLVVLALLVGLLLLPGPAVVLGAQSGLTGVTTVVPTNATATPLPTSTATPLPTSTTTASVVDGGRTVVGTAVAGGRTVVGTATGVTAGTNASAVATATGLVEGSLGTATPTDVVGIIVGDATTALHGGLTAVARVGTRTTPGPSETTPTGVSRSPSPTPTPTTNASAAAVAAGGTGAPAGDGGGAGGSGGSSSPLPPVSPVAGGVAIGGAAVAAGLLGRSALAGSEPATLGPALSASKGAVGRAAEGLRLRLGGRPPEVGRLVEGLGARLRPILGLFGYQRYDDSDPLDHAGRARLFEHVRREPGVHQSALAAAADMPLSTVRYHLRILEHEGLVRTASHRGKRRCFPPDVEAEALAVALAEPAPAAVLWSLVRGGPATVRELAARLDRSESTVSYHLDRLETDGLVERERRGQAVVSEATAAVTAAVERLSRDDGSAVVESRPVAVSD